jgi:hypothetical protein
MSILEQAEAADHYLATVASSPINAAARADCSYTLWPDQSLAARAQAIVGDKAKVIILHPTAEGGMPHTRGLTQSKTNVKGMIALPAYYPESRLAETLRHELVHIEQRRAPPALEPEWQRADEREIPEHFLSRARLNPDTAQARWWAWEGRHIPIPVFEREDKPRLQDITVFWYDRRTGRAIRQPPATFTAAYGEVTAAQAEHPYELAAYLPTK